MKILAAIVLAGLLVQTANAEESPYFRFGFGSTPPAKVAPPDTDGNDGPEQAPSMLRFPSVGGLNPGQFTSSNTVGLTGYGSSAPMSVAGDGIPWFTVNSGSLQANGTVKDGDILQLFAFAPTGFNATETVTVSVGRMSSTWSLTTRSMDSVPDAFEIVARDGVEPESIVESAPVVPNGYLDPADVTVTGYGNPEFSVDGGPWTTSGTMSPKSSIRARLRSDAEGTTARSAMLTVGGVSAPFVATTRALRLTIADPADRTLPPGGAAIIAFPTVTGATGPLAYRLYLGDADVSNSLGSYCPGLSFDPADGRIAGTPVAACSRVLSYWAQDRAIPLPARSETFLLSVPTPSISVSQTSFDAVENTRVILNGTTTLANPKWGLTGQPIWMVINADGKVNNLMGDVTEVTTSVVRLTAEAGGILLISQPVTVTVRPGGGSLKDASARSGAAWRTDVLTNFGAGTWSVSSSPADMTNLAAVGTDIVGTAPINPGPDPIARTLTVSKTGGAIAAGPRAFMTLTSTITVYPNLAVASVANKVGIVDVRAALPGPELTGVIGRPTYAIHAGTADVSSNLGCAGLSLNANTGAISGVPTAPCTVTGLTYVVTDPAGGNALSAQTVTSNAFSLAVTQDVSFTATGPASYTVVQNQAASSPRPASRNGSGTVTWSTPSTLPTGLSVNASTGVIHGKTSQTGTFEVRLTATDATGATAEAKPPVALTVAPDAPALYYTAAGPASGNGHTFDLGTTSNGLTGKTQTISVSNSGARPASALTVTIQETNGGGAFSLASMDTCASPLPVNATCSFTIAVRGDPNGPHAGSIQVSDVSGVKVVAGVKVVTQGIVEAGNRLFTGMADPVLSRMDLPEGVSSLKVRLLIMGSGASGQSGSGYINNRKWCQYDGGGSATPVYVEYTMTSSMTARIGGWQSTNDGACSEAYAPQSNAEFTSTAGFDEIFTSIGGSWKDGGTGGGACGTAGGTGGGNGGGSADDFCHYGTGRSAGFDLTRLKQRRFTWGAGGAPGQGGYVGTDEWVPGGGGGGGIVIDGDDSGAQESWFRSAPELGSPGKGWGAGGYGGRSDTGLSGHRRLTGGPGASGFVYIEWSRQ